MVITDCFGGGRTSVFSVNTPIFVVSRGGSRISGKGVHMYKGVGGSFADFISLFLKNIP